MMENIQNDKFLSEEVLGSVAGGARSKTARTTGNATKICLACQLRVDASNKKCPYCGGKLSEE